MVILADTHTHLDQFPPIELTDIIGRARLSGVSYIIAAGTTLQSSKDCIRLATQHRGVFAGVGLHPMNVSSLVDDATYASLRSLAINNPNVACISEIGMDFLPQAPDKELQDQAFRAQIRLAKELHLPVIVHSRDSYQQTLRILKEERADHTGGAIHYFQGNMSEAQQALELGFYISMAKPLLRIPELQEVAAKIPMERIILETDSYPQYFKKHRDRWTEPKDTRTVAMKLAEIKNLTLFEVAEITTANCCSLLTGINTSNNASD